MKLEISTAHLSFGSQSDDVARVQQAIQALGRDIPADETGRRVFGPGTVAVVKALQTDLSVPATGIVDAATVTAINAALTKLVTDARTIRGRVSDADGNPAKGLSLQLYLEDPAGEKVIGKSALDADGAYQISYLPPENSARVDLRIEVRDQTAAVDNSSSLEHSRKRQRSRGGELRLERRRLYAELGIRSCSRRPETAARIP